MAEDYADLLKHLAKIDHIEQMPDGDLILGLAGERIVRSRDFYAVFETPPEWDVLHGARTLGRISPSPDLLPGTCLLLVGRVWEVKEILPDQKQVLVIPAKEARNVLFAGTGIPEMHPRIAQRVRDLLGREDSPRYLSPEGQTALADARKSSAQFNLGRTQIFETAQDWILFPWTGTRAARTLQLLFNQNGLEAGFPNMLFPWVMRVKRTPDVQDLRAKLEIISRSRATPEDLVSSLPVELLKIHKFDEFLPERLLRSRAIEEWIDWDGARKLLTQLTEVAQTKHIN